MVGWLIGIALTVVGLVNRDSTMLVAAGLFALTGAVSAMVCAMKSDVE